MPPSRSRDARKAQAPTEAQAIVAADRELYSIRAYALKHQRAAPPIPPSKERDENGRLNLDCDADAPRDTAFDEQAEDWINYNWPYFHQMSFYYNDAVTSDENRPAFDSSYRLHRAHGTVLPTLARIQLQLIQAKVPSYIWPLHVRPLLSGDFLKVKEWIMRRIPTWMLLVEAILTVLDDFDELIPPLVAFSKLQPSAGETAISFLKGIQLKFSSLSEEDKFSQHVHDTILDYLRQNMPEVWLLITPELRRTSNPPELLNQALKLARRLKRELKAAQNK